MKKFAISALAVAALAGSALGQSARVDLRIVPQNGTPGVAPGVSEDAVADTAGARVTLGAAKRFEVQYRIIDLITTDTIVPAGLSALVMNITVSNAANGTLTRAITSLSEANAGARPPRTAGQPAPTVVWLMGPTPDVSAANPTGRTGMHSPFRGGFSDQNDNNLAANGTPAPGALNGILPLSLSQNNQGLAGFDLSVDQDGSQRLTGGEWYGLYSFIFTPGAVGDFTITATATADPGTGNRFGYFNNGIPVPAQSTQAADGLFFGRIIPAPGTLALLGLGGLVAGRRRRA